jgi:hypothetical protein
MSGTFPKQSGDNLPATDWNVVAAQADASLKPTGNLAGLANAAAARANLGLHPVAASGDYDALTNRRLDTTDGTAGAVDFVDDGMETYAYIGNDGLVIGGTTFAPDGSVALSVATLASAEISASDASAGLDFIDDGMEVAASINSDGSLEGFAGTTATHSDAELGWRNAENLTESSAMATRIVTNIARPVYELNHFISYGQSLSIGSEGTPVLTTAATYGNLMYGDQVRPTTNNSATATWDRVGASAFNGMVATGGTEVPIIGAINTYRRMYLASRGVASDANIRFVASSAGIGGRNIAQLTLGASPDIFQRVISVMDQANAQATSDGFTYGVAAMLWLQGESNMTTLAADYLAALRTIYADFKAAAIAETGQADPPAFFTYQTTQVYASDSVDMGTQMAQLTMALEDDGVFMVGPVYPYPDSNNLHLPANSYRWLGAQFGKVMHRVLTLGHRWKPLYMRRATRRGLEVLIDYHVPYPPLAFEDPWMQDGWFIGETALGQTNTRFAVPNKGFSIRSTTGAEQTISDIAIVSDTQILLTLAVEPSASLSLVLRYANGKNAQFGHGCVRDSDPALADEEWEHVTSRTDADTNAALLGARYPLHNWAVAQQIDIEVLT